MINFKNKDKTFLIPKLVGSTPTGQQTENSACQERKPRKSPHYQMKSANLFNHLVNAFFMPTKFKKLKNLNLPRALHTA